MSVEKIEIATRDGTAPAHLLRGGKAGVILYMDAFGVRPALDQMGERLVALGYTVLIPDLFYRFGPYDPFDAKTAFGEEATKVKIMGMMGATSQALTVADTGAFLDALSEAGATGPVGAVGYCLGGGRALHAAAAYPDRIKAAASLHGGNLAADSDDSPHRAAAQIKARVYVGVAGVDRSFPPEQSATLARALREAEVDHQIENYVGKAHGWCVPDSAVFDHEGAERHWKRIATLFAETLGGQG
jgi:carboxymethylenebutenolidase